MALFFFFDHAHPLEHSHLVGDSRTFLSVIDDPSGQLYCSCFWYCVKRCRDFQKTSLTREGYKLAGMLFLVKMASTVFNILCSWREGEQDYKSIAKEKTQFSVKLVVWFFFLNYQTFKNSIMYEVFNLDNLLQ